MGILMTTDIMAVFDVILIVYGIYTIYASIKMKKTGEPVNWLVGEQEAGKCRDMKGFIDAISGKTIAFGGIAVLYGVVSTFNRMQLKIGALDTVCIIVFLVVCGVYIVALNRAKKKFF